MTMTNFHSRFIRHSLNSQYALWRWWLLAITGLVVARLVQMFWLDPAYAQSQYPVPFFVGQTTFNAEELKGYYQVMLDKGTLPLYWLTQCIDFVFIACTYWAFFALTQSIYHSIKRVLPQASRWQVVAKVWCFIAPLAAVADAAENIVSFIMLLQPVTFLDFWVYPYSSFAVIKFAIFALTYLWAVINLFALLVILAVHRLQHLFTKPILN
ncbi:MAG TPA: hypothetical protein PKD17_04705 [Cellvibrionaceae bacterium]|nr:hypothetical protein [Cellvibrionaceae bacterium]HNG59797.1 hypothetical protein [Cellvibrionaceae bacterium]